jgi:CBS-domain-containing membrane protein
MAPADSVQRVRIYLSRDDQWEGGPRYLALIEQLRRSGATGATALQGLAGFGPGHRSRLAAPDNPEQHQPVVVEWIDRVDRVARLLPLLDELIGDALVTVEDVPVYRATLRARGPFAGDRAVGDVMRRPPPAVAATAPLAEAVALLCAEGLGVLPVVDGEGRPAGLLTPQDLVWRAGLRLPLALLDLLAPEERGAALAPLDGRAAGDVMSAEPRSVVTSTAIPQAIVTMVEWGYPQVPVVDRSGVLAGLLGQEDVLRAAVEQAGEAEGAVRDADAPATVALVMQSAPTLPAAQPLNVALAQLVAAPERPLLLVDGGRLVGALDAAAALRGLAGEERAAFLAALQRPQPVPAAALPGADRRADLLRAAAPPTVAPETPILVAARRLLELRVGQLAVVAADGALFGIIARGGLIRALMQQSD